jgi:hypothetical protein
VLDEMFVVLIPNEFRKGTSTLYTPSCLIAILNHVPELSTELGAYCLWVNPQKTQQHKQAKNSKRINEIMSQI